MYLFAIFFCFLVYFSNKRSLCLQRSSAPGSSGVWRAGACTRRRSPVARTTSPVRWWAAPAVLTVCWAGSRTPCRPWSDPRSGPAFLSSRCCNKTRWCVKNTLHIITYDTNRGWLGCGITEGNRKRLLRYTHCVCWGGGILPYTYAVDIQQECP